MDEHVTTELQKRGQAALIEFLKTELDLAFTFLDTADVDRDEPETVNKLLHKVRDALETVRRFEGRIGEPSAWSAVHGRADELETAMQSFPRAGK